jgi:DNA polymerase
MSNLHYKTKVEPLKRIDNVFLIDFETRSDVNLKKTNSYVYAEGKETDVLCLVIKQKDKIFKWSPHHICDEFNYCPNNISHKELKEITDNPYNVFFAHNATFERDIFEKVMTRYGYRCPNINQFRCTQALAASRALPRVSLAEVAKFMSLPIQKNDLGGNLIKLLSIPNVDKIPFINKKTGLAIPKKRLIGSSLKKYNANLLLEKWRRGRVSGVINFKTQNLFVALDSVSENFNVDIVCDYLLKGDYRLKDFIIEKYSLSLQEYLFNFNDPEKEILKQYEEFYEGLEELAIDLSTKTIMNGEDFLINRSGFLSHRLSLKQMIDYCIQDVLVLENILKKMPYLDEYSQRIHNLYMDMNARGMKVDVAMVDGILSIKEPIVESISEELAHLTENKIEKPTQKQRLLNYAKSRFNVTLENVTNTYLKEFMDANTFADETLLQIMDLVLEGGGNSSLAKVDACKNLTSSKGRVNNYLKWHGAATGRAGGSGFQPQNLPRGMAHPIPEIDNILKGMGAGHGDRENARQVLTDALCKSLAYNAEGFNDILFDCNGKKIAILKSLLRSIIIPDNGKVFVIADLASIEAVLINWMAGQENVVQAFREKKDVYCMFASQIYNRPIVKATHPLERKVGKEGVLGCGYSMGARTFYGRLIGQGLRFTAENCLNDIPEEHYNQILYKIENMPEWFIDSKTNQIEDLHTMVYAKFVVDKYRQAHPKIVELWSNLDNAFKVAVGGRRTFIPIHGNVGLEFGYCKNTKTVYISLPSKRKIWYPNTYIGSDGTAYRSKYYQGKMVKDKIYGGKLAENICQAMATDIAHEWGIKVVEQHENTDFILQIHDENIWSFPLATENKLEIVVQALQELGEWTKTIPLSCSAFEAIRFMKDAG